MERFLITEYKIWQAHRKQLRPILLHVYMQKILSVFRSDNFIISIKLANGSARVYFIDLRDYIPTYTLAARSYYSISQFKLIKFCSENGASRAMN